MSDAFQTVKIAMAALAVVATTASATVPLKPPDEYMHPYNGKVVITYLPTNNVRRQCGYPERDLVRGCAVVDKDGVCRITIAKYAKISSRDMLLWHEIAHCNGWVHE